MKSRVQVLDEQRKEGRGASEDFQRVARRRKKERKKDRGISVLKYLASPSLALRAAARVTASKKRVNGNIQSSAPQPSRATSRMPASERG